MIFNHFYPLFQMNWTSNLCCEMIVLQWFSYKRRSLGKCPIRFLILDYNFASVLRSFCQESARKLAKCLTIGFFSARLANFVQNAMKKDWLPIWRLQTMRKKTKKKVWACILSSFCHKLLLLLFALMLAELLIVITLFTIPRRHRDNRIFINAQIKYGFSLGRRQPVIHCVWKN